MASELNSQPSFLPPLYLPTMNSSDSHHEITSGISGKAKHNSIFNRLFGNLHAKPFIYTDELKQYSVNGCYNGRTVITKKYI
jgi:hypothetical protein